MSNYKGIWQNIIHKIIGKPGEVSLKNRIANTTLAITVLYASFTIYNNILFNLPLPTIYASLFIVVSYSVLYYFSRFKKKSEITIDIALLFAFLVYTPVMWINNGGIGGSFPFYIFMFGAFTFSVVKGKKLLFFLILLLLVSASLIILEYIYPEIIVQYSNESDKFYDILVNYILVFIGMSFLMYYYTKQYYSYNEKLNKSNIKLEEINSQLSERIKEREVLLKEIHHRVKNNLQMVISLLNLQINTEKNEELNKLLQISQDRINAISIVHEQLYKSDTLESININEYLTDLIKNIAGVTNPKTQKISMDVIIENAIIDISKTIPIGLIINELISNSLKYAFKNKKSGTINIKGYKKNKKYQILFKDNGKGMPDNFKVEESNSLGFKLILGLASQINGKFKIIKAETGSEFKIEFEI